MRKIGLGFAALAFKIGPKVFSALVSLAKGLKVGKAGLAATSLAAYSYIFTWEFALIIMIALFVHESGHIWAMKRRGLKTKGIYFIPLLGAAAVSDEEFPSRSTESFIALMGPIWGFVLAGLAGVIYFLTEAPLFAAAASWMAMLNLFNLLPINPLDGGRVFKSIAYSISSGSGIAFLIIGLVVASFLATGLGMTLFVFLLIVGVIDLVLEYRRRTEILKMERVHILSTVLVYLVITVLLWTIMDYMKHIPGAEAAMELLTM